MILHEIVRALERIERNQAVLLERLAAPENKGGETTEKAPEWGPQEAAARLPGERRSDAASEVCRLRRTEGCKVRDDDWIQDGIDNILSYQAGKKRGDGQ